MCQTYPFPCISLRVVLKPRYVFITACFTSDEGGFGDEQRARFISTLTVVLYSKVAVDMFCICTIASQRREDDSVFEIEVADLDRLE